MKKILSCVLMVLFYSAFGGLFDKKFTEQDVVNAILHGRGDGVEFMMTIHKIVPSSIRVSKGSMDGIWSVQYETTGELLGKKKYIGEAVANKSKKGDGCWLHFVNLSGEVVKKQAPVEKPSVMPEEKIYGKGNIEDLEVNGLASFCGYVFGEDYRNEDNWNRGEAVFTVELKKPFRYCTKAQLSHTRLEGDRFALSRIVISGQLPESFSKEQLAEEYKAVAQILEKKYSVKFDHEYFRPYDYSFGRYNEEKKWRTFFLCSGTGFGDRHEYECRITVENNIALKREIESKKKDLTADEGADVL